MRFSKSLLQRELEDDSSSDDDDYLIFSAALVEAFSNAKGRHGGSVSGTVGGHAMELDDAFRKRTRTSGVLGGSSAGGPDWLSSLPDCILHTIMSFLKARQVVQTCVLSTRWRYLWRSVPCLDIDFDEFKKAPPPDVKADSYGDNNAGSGGEENSESDGNGYSESSDDDSSCFESDTYDSESDRWHVDPDNNYKDWEDFEDFAVTLMRRCNVAQLDSLRLHIVPDRAPEFGNRVAAGWLCRTMKYFTPDRGSRLGLSSGSWFLKRLHLCNLLLDDHFVKCVSSVCRSLEDLELDGCCSEIKSITSDSLKTLVLRTCEFHCLSEIISPTLKTLVIDDGRNGCALVILAPSVVYVHLAMHVYSFPFGVSLNEVPSVAKAFIHLKDHKKDWIKSELGGNQFKLLSSISNSTNLELSGVGTTVLVKETGFQEFKNLRNLLLDNCDLSDDFNTLVFFLRSSPILEKLTLRCCEFPEYPNKKKVTPNKTSSSEVHGLDLLCENLKVEIIYEYGSGQHLMKLLQRVSVNLSKNNIKLTKIN